MRNWILGTLLLIGLTSQHAIGQFYWVAKTSPSSWNDPLNWSNISGGTGGFGVPGAGDQVVFDGAAASNGNCFLDVARTVTSIKMNGVYAGLIDLRGNNFTISAGAATPSIFTKGSITNSMALALITITSSSNVSPITFNGTTFGVNVDISSNTKVLLLNGSVFNGTCNFAITDGAPSTSTGKNIFNGPVSFTLTSVSTSWRFDLASTDPDTFNGTVGVSLIGAATQAPTFRFSTGANSIFNGDLTLASNYTNSNNVRGIYFGNGVNSTAVTSTGGTSTLSTSAKLLLTPPFRGYLRFENFLHQGTTHADLTLSNDANSILVIGSSTFNGNITADAARLFIASSTFKGNSNIFYARSATTSSQVGAGNTFGTAGLVSSTTFVRGAASTNFDIGMNTLNTGFSSYLTATGSDTYNSNVTFQYSGGGVTCMMRPGYSGISYYAGDITYDNNSSGNMNFGSSGSCTMTFTGNSNQNINQSGTGKASFTLATYVMGKTSPGRLILNTPITISACVFNVGIISSTLTNLLTFNGNSNSGASNFSHVDGPVAKAASTSTGFTFPTGSNGLYSPIDITFASGGADVFVAQSFHLPASAVGVPFNAPLAIVSGCEYWSLNRTGSVSKVGVSVSWTSANCPQPQYVLNPADLRVAQFSGGAWNNVGTTGGGTNAFGSVSTSAPLNSFGFFTLASISTSNPLPVKLISFESERVDYGIKLKWLTTQEVDNDHFSVERMNEEMAFEDIGVIEAISGNAIFKSYEFIDNHPLNKKNYYRLKQVDIDNTATYSPVISEDFKQLESLFVYPNPIDKGGRIAISQTGDFSIIDSRGYLMASLKNTNEFETDILSPGIYALVSDQGKFVRFLVK